MAVTVTLERYHGGKPSGVETYAEANDFIVNNGHLAVVKPNTRGGTITVGLYAPGEWRTVHKDDERAFTEEE